MAWTFHAPSGTYKNRSLSKEIRREAIADAITMQFLKPESEFGKGKGESHTITRIMRLPLAGRLAETDLLPSGRPAIQTKTVSVSDWGFKIPVTELERNLTHFDPYNAFQVNLKEQMTLTLDVMAADAFKQTPIKYVPTVAGANITNNGTPSGTSNRNVAIEDLRRLFDYMHGTLKIPPYRNGKYILLGSTRLMRGLKNDPEYKDWRSPHTEEPIMTGKLPATIEGFDLYETNHYDAWANLAGASTTTGEGMAFGADAAGLLEVMAPEIRRAPFGDDLGRFFEVGWVGTLEAFLTWEDPATARAVHITSA